MSLVAPFFMEHGVSYVFAFGQNDEVALSQISIRMYMWDQHSHTAHTQ